MLPVSITENTVVTGLEKTGCRLSHIQHCLIRIHRSEFPNYTYFGKRVTRGTMVIHTRKGDFTVRFDEKDGFARKIEIL